MPENEAPTKDELLAAKCWFPDTDRVSGRDDVTAFKKHARLHQARWRESHGFPIGSHVRPDGTSAENGSKMAPEGPIDQDFRNFLDSSTIRDAVRHRSGSEAREPGQQLKTDRLRYDLLSSMPMCFNLFGELHNSTERLEAAGKRLLGLDRPGLSVQFEHSPKRQSIDYSNDGTAFDVALFFGEVGGPQTIVGIETKYHEHAVAEARPDTLTKRRPVIPENKKKLSRYLEIANRAQEEGIFKPGWERLLGTELQQIWRDHLLLLSMLQHRDGAKWDAGTYVLVHPERNAAFAEAGELYRTFLDDDRTFRVKTIEELLKPGVLHEKATAQEFKDRYLW